jgi:predicted acetyltransferase
MPESLSITRPASEGEVSAMLDLMSRTFNFPRDHAGRYHELVGPANFRVARRGGTMAGGLAIIPMGQYFGGRPVSMAGIAAVAVAPHARAAGVAGSMMSHVVRELRDAGFALSTLYPATQPVYRRAGFESAGSRHEITVAAKVMRPGEPDRSLAMRPITPEDHAVVEALYEAQAARSNGPLRRSPFHWKRIREPRIGSAAGWLVHHGDSVEGYAYLVQVEAGTAAPYSLQCSDLRAATPAAARRLIGFLADHRSMADKVTWFGRPNDPVLLNLREPWIEVQLRDHWMLRVLDVHRALEDRGYAPGIRAELHLDIHDPVIESNRGRFVVRVEDGAATVSSGGRGDLRLGVNGLAAMYSGFASPLDLVDAGLIAVADDRSAIAAGPVFAGSMPWMSDTF